MKQCAKPLQKIRQAENRTYNIKKQNSKHTNKQTIVYNAYQNTVQIAKVKQAKKHVSLILLFQSKKRQQQHRKKNVTPKKYACEIFCMKEVCCICAKSHNARKKHRSKPGQLDLTIQKQK